MDEMNQPNQQNSLNNPVEEQTSQTLKGELPYKRNDVDEVSYNDFFSDEISYKGSEDRKPPYKEKLPITVVGGVELMEKDIPPRRLLMSPWLPEQGIAMIYAARGIGKTFLALEIALALATGTKFLGWETEQPVKVLYIDGEMSASDLQSRIKMMERGRRELLKGQIEFITPDMQDGACPDLSQYDWHNHLTPFVKEAKVIIVDNISTLCRTGNENDSDSWQVVQEWAIQQKSAGKTVLFVHHAGKGGQQRGTSKREDVMDSVIALKRPDDYIAKQGARFEVHFEKSRGFSGDAAEPFVVQLIQEGEQFTWGSDSLEETLYQKIVGLLQLGMDQKDIAIELNVNKSTVSRNVKKAKNEGLL
jgi:KaiC/GvpD/RAD55 family RecA-like ATPase